MDALLCRLDASGYSRIGFPEHYDRYRPRLAPSEGSTQTLLDAGATEEEIGLDRLRREAEGIPEPVPWWIGYRAWIGLK